jgi:DNA sulfur modification protein DndD
VALQQATEQKKAHQDELRRLQSELSELGGQRIEAEQRLQSNQKYASILEERDQAIQRLTKANAEEQILRGDLQKAMSKAWRSLVRDPLRAARQAAQVESERELNTFAMSLRARAVDTGHCGTCEQDIPEAIRARLRSSLPERAGGSLESHFDLSAAMARVGDLNKFQEADNAGEIRQLWKRIEGLRLEQVSLKDRITDLEGSLSVADPDEVRRIKTSYHDISEKIAIVKRGIEEGEKKIAEKETTIERLKSKLVASGGSDLKASQLRASILRDSANVLNAAVERYKANLRSRVETTASKLFRLMTTEKEDYESLTINEVYGLTIRHRDGRAEEARSAGAEHVVALALMGALQKNAPLRGPIVMDSPFGRLDERHTSNVVRTLPEMAQQVILLVYESEVGRARMRELLGSALVREYELERVTSRRTRIRAVK